MITPVIDKVVAELENLPENLQRQVLEFVQKLKASTMHGVSGTRLLSFAGTIPSGDLELMRQAIETDCEWVEPNLVK